MIVNNKVFRLTESFKSKYNGSSSGLYYSRLGYYVIGFVYGLGSDFKGIDLIQRYNSIKFELGKTYKLDIKYISTKNGSIFGSTYVYVFDGSDLTMDEILGVLKDSLLSMNEPFQSDYLVKLSISSCSKQGG